MQARHRVLASYLGWMALLTVGFLAVESAPGRTVLWGLMVFSGTAVMIWGVARLRPARPAPWLLLAAGLFFLGLGDTWTLLLRSKHPTAYIGYPPLHVVYSLTFVFMLAGLVGLARTGTPERDRAGMLDALTVTAGVGLLSWIFIIAPRVDDPGITLLEKIGAGGYPLGMLLFLAMAVRLAVSMRRSTALTLLIAGIVALSAGEMMFLISALGKHVSRPGTGPDDLGYILLYVCWAAAALHPSMRTVSRPRSAWSGSPDIGRLTVLSACSLTPSIVLIVLAVRGTLRFELLLGALGAVMLLLVLTRLFGVLRHQRETLARERLLRRAGTALVSVTTPEGLDAAVAAGVRDLAPSGADCQVVLVRGEEVGADANDAAIHRPADLPMPHRLTLRRFPAVLSCPLAAVNPPDPGAAQPPLGHLLVGASEEVLGRLRGSLEILAVQTAMALTRISLTTEINKRDSELYFRALVQQATDVILIIDEQGIIRYQSPSARTLLGAPALSGQAVVNLVQPEQLELAVDLLKRMADGQPVPQDLDWTVQAGDSVLHLAASWRDLRADPTVAGFVVTLRDVTEQRRLEQELTFRAYHDPLTGLPNRALFAEEVAEAELRGCGHSVTGVLFVDLDNFKDVNDTLGHGVGDQLLIAVAARLTAAIRPGDLAARLGGDEFAILVRDAADRSVVEEVADGVLAALSTPVLVERRAIRVSGSIGLATTADSGTADLLHNADQALYSAKQAGKGGWRGYRDPRPAALRLPTPIDERPNGRP